MEVNYHGTRVTYAKMLHLIKEQMGTECKRVTVLNAIITDTPYMGCFTVPEIDYKCCCLGLSGNPFIERDASFVLELASIFGFCRILVDGYTFGSFSPLDAPAMVTASVMFKRCTWRGNSRDVLDRLSDPYMYVTHLSLDREAIKRSKGVYFKDMNFVHTPIDLRASERIRKIKFDNCVGQDHFLRLPRKRKRG